MARRECAMAALFPAERIGGLASLQPATLRLAADVRYGGHARRSDGQQGFAECPLWLQWQPNLCAATNRRDGPTHKQTHAVQQSTFHSITLSARNTRLAGTSCLIVCAALRLMTSSNRVGCSTGMSAGLMPRRTFTACRLIRSR